MPYVPPVPTYIKPGQPSVAWNQRPYGEPPYAGTLDTLVSPVAPSSEAHQYIYENVQVSLSISSAVMYIYENVTTTAPMPYIWDIFPTAANPGETVTVVGTGFGSAQSTFNGQILFDNQTLPSIFWEDIPATPNAYTPDRQISPATGTVDPEHDQVAFVIPEGAFSGLVKISTVT